MSKHLKTYKYEITTPYYMERIGYVFTGTVKIWADLNEEQLMKLVKETSNGILHGDLKFTKLILVKD